MSDQEKMTLGELFVEILLPKNEYYNNSLVYIENTSSGSIKEHRIFVEEVAMKLGEQLSEEKESLPINKAIRNLNTIVQTANTFGLTPIIRITEEKVSDRKYESNIQVEIGTVYGVVLFNVGKVKSKKNTIENKIRKTIKPFKKVNPPEWVVDIRGSKPKKRKVAYVFI